jgi:hypothetical protein
MALDVGVQSGLRIPHVRTLYGNLMALDRPGEYMADVKISDPRDRPPDGVFVSSNDRAFGGVVGAWVRERLPDPCRYEALSALEEVA